MGLKDGRSDRIRTCDVLLPKQALYRAEPRSEPFFLLDFIAFFKTAICVFYTDVLYYRYESHFIRA